MDNSSDYTDKNIYISISRNHNHNSLTSNRLYFGTLYDDQVYKYSMRSTWQAISPILLDVMAVKSTLQINEF